jgi:uncharacterized membrane protein YeaQ/YmgE (transglycosylase-associated protein family)
MGVLADSIKLIDAGFFSCFEWFFAGAIAGTIANFVVRGRLGCIVTNFVLGLLSAFVAGFILSFIPFFNGKDAAIGFFGTTVIASVSATLIAYLIHTLRRAEGRYQQKLLDRS